MDTNFSAVNTLHPTHSTPPAFVIEAREAARRAWRKQDELTEDYLAYRTDIETVNAATEAAKAADAYAADCYEAWERGDEGAIACTCTPPTSDTCAGRASPPMWTAFSTSNHD